MADNNHSASEVTMPDPQMDGPLPANWIDQMAMAAAGLRELFLAYTGAGFTEQQALYLIGQLMRGAGGTGE
jgi:hypothetical protein